MEEIKIIGAGPSGLSAAINLAKVGFNVKVFERGSECGHRFGGDIQCFQNSSREKNIIEDLKDMNISINFDCDALFETVFMTDRQMCTLKGGMPSYLVKRGPIDGSLDMGLKKQALDSGAEIIFNSTIPSEEADIIATGPFGKEIFAVDKGIIFETDMEDILVGLVDTRAHVKGYAYLIVTKGYGCMCTVLADKFQMINHCFDEAKKIFERHFKFEIRNPRKVGGVGAFSIKNQFSKDGKLYVGEAAGLQDMLGGFGIRTAITSGYLAAESIIKKQDYQELAKSRFERKLKASLAGRFIWETIGSNFTNDLMIRMLRKNKLRNFLSTFSSNDNGMGDGMLFNIALSSLSKRYKELRA